MSFPKYPEYKDSGVEWLGEVPAHWVVAPFKWQLDSNDGGVWGEDPAGENDTFVLRSTDQSVDGNWKISDPALRALSERDKRSAVLKKGDLVVTKSSGSSLHIGKTTLVSEEIEAMNCCFGNFMQRLRTKSSLHPKLAWYIMNNGIARLQLDLLSNSTTGLANLNGTIIGEIILSIPPVDEQANIAAFLDHETARIDALIEEQQRLIELLKEKRQAVISHAVTKGLDPDVPMKDSGVEWLGEVPAHWEVRKIAQSFNRIGSGTTPPSNEQKWYEGGSIPWVTTSELRETVIVETKKSVTEEALSEFTSLQLHPPGSLAIAMYGATIGRLGVFGVSATSNQACCVLSGGRGVSTGFVYYWLLAFKGVIISLYATGGGQPNINQETISSLRIPAPSLEDQQDITAYLDDETSRIEDLVEEGLSVIKLLQERRSALISAAVTGKIDVRGWQPPAGSSALTEATRTEAV